MSENDSIGGQPVYEHDCNICVFLGQYDGQDLYFHRNDAMFVRPNYEQKQSRFPEYYRDGYMEDTGSITILARHGSDGDYYSYSLPRAHHFNTRDWETVAIERAVAKGYMLQSEQSEVKGMHEAYQEEDDRLFADGPIFDEPWYQERYETEKKARHQKLQDSLSDGSFWRGDI
tara:strand:- start:48 stop:566 length:519 start_codon:yes stop_codon:yes gene_type:complete